MTSVLEEKLMPSKKRLDLMVYEAGFAESREKAKALIMSGIIYVDGQKSDKPGTAYPETVKLEMRGAKPKYVSRGGLKLEKAMKSFSLRLDGMVTMDIGASLTWATVSLTGSSGMTAV